MSRNTAALFALLVISSGAQAGLCEDPPSTLEKRQCYAAAAEEQDKRLNAIWKKAVANVPAAGEVGNENKARPRFIEAQKAWLKYRDSQCLVEGGLEGGSDQWVALFAQECSLRMTDERITFLKSVAGE